MSATITPKGAIMIGDSFRRRRSEILLALFCVSTLTTAVLVGFMWHQRVELIAIRHLQILYPGDPVVPLRGFDLDGQPSVVQATSQHGTLLYVFSPGCLHCRRNEAAVRSLYARLRQQRIAFYGIALDADGAREHVRSSSYPFPVVIAEPDSARALKLGSTPETIFIGADAKVRQVWLGEYVGKVRTSIESTFTITLAATLLSQD